MTREELSQFKNLNSELKMWQEELEKIRYSSLAKGQEITGMPHGSSTASDRTSEIGMKAVEAEENIEKLMEEIRAQKTKIIVYIRTIEDSLIRQIIFQRYINGLTWKQVAAAIGKGYTKDSVRMAHNNFFEKK